MRGFERRVTVEAALEWLDAELDARVRQLVCETVPLASANGRVLGRDVASDVDVPSFCRAMMDGFAVRAADTEGASSYNRLSLAEIGASRPGRAFEGRVAEGEAVRIMTGAPLPEGADAVLPVEKTESITAEDGATHLFALATIPPGKHVGTPGEDIAAGTTVLGSGRRLRPQDLGVLSSIGVAELCVVRRPRVRIVITGNELLPAGSAPHGYHITDANGPMLAALVERDGGLPIHPGIVADDRHAIRQALLGDVDVVLVAGGSSVGEEDHAPAVVAEEGNLAIHGIAMRPSSPTGMGTIGAQLVVLLPGNPVSALCAYDFFAGRAIRALAGLRRDWPYRSLRAPLARKLVSVVGRVDYARVRLVDGQVEPLAIAGASVLSSTTRADGFVIIAGDSEGYAAGSEVDVFLYDVPYDATP